jgi:glucose-6-phosphate 1-epimerase
MVVLEKFENRFEYLYIKNSVAEAKIALQGAHIFSFKPHDKEEFFWLSDKSEFEEGKAIRGGVPLCWPAFGTNNPDLPQHGFARTSLFKFIGSKELDEETTQLHFTLQETEGSLTLWSYKFRLEFIVTISQNIKMQLITTNKDKQSFALTQAFHSYFNISHISNVKLKGLQGTKVLDTLTNKTTFCKDTIKFDEEYDRVFQGVEKVLYLEDDLRVFTIEQSGAKSVVVWNPWIDKSKKMSGMRDNAYKEFVCVESANAFENVKILKAGEVDKMLVTIGC